MAQGKGRPLYMGVDIESGSPSSTTRRPLYSAVIVDGEGKTVASYSGITLARLIRLTWQFRPEVLAVDNILELASTRKSLERVLELFPPDTRIVQVTLTKQGPAPLRSVAGSLRDLLGPGKPRPGRTAYILALLASRGEGVPVRVVEQKTRIIVAKARSSRAGGYSQQRYQRRIRASVMNAAMRVKEALDREGLDYDMSYRRSEGGFESAVFTVYAPRERLVGVVRPHRGVDYVIMVKPEYRVVLNIGGEERAKDRPVIVGIDPGTTTGLAVIDLHGRVLHLGSYKNMDRGSMLEEIRRHGKPIIVAVDVPVPPETVRRVATKLGAIIFSPSEELSVAEKRSLAEKALGGSHPQDSHQRDALAAAYKAYSHLKSKLGHVESQLRRLGIDLDIARVKEAVIRGLTVAEAVEEAIEERLMGISGEHTSEPGKDALQPRRGSDPALYERLASLEEEVELLRSRLKELREENERLRVEIELVASRIKAEAYRDALVRKLEAELAILQGEVEKLRGQAENLRATIRGLEELLFKLWIGEAVLALRLPSLTVRNLRRLLDSVGSIEGSLLYIDSPSFEQTAIHMLAQERVLGVVSARGGVEILRRALKRYTIPVFSLGELEIEPLYIAQDYVVLPGDLEDLLEQERNRLVEERARVFSLEKIISEYRRMRTEGARRA